MKKSTCTFGPKPSHGLPHDDEVRGTVPTRRNSVLARTNRASLTMATILIIDDEEPIRALLRTTA